MSAMRDTMLGQPAALRTLIADAEPVERAARVLAGHRILLVGTGTSFHAACHGAWLLREAGVEAWPVLAIDAALHRPRPGAGDALVLLSHTGATRYARQVLAEARAGLVPTVTIGSRGSEAALSTVEPETSAAYTASHLGALLRLAQLAEALGARLGPLEDAVAAVERALDGPGPRVRPPARLLELVGAGPNAWTAAEGALKVRETARIAAEGMNAEQFLHGPSAALDARDTLVALDGGGPASGRLAGVAAAAEQVGVTVRVLSSPPELGEPLSVLPLTAAVQRIALECAEALGTDPDAFGYDVPGREAAWEPLGF